MRAATNGELARGPPEAYVGRRMIASEQLSLSYGSRVLFENVDIKFHRSESAEYWDLKVIDKDGNEIVWQNLDLLKISKVTIKYKEGEATASVE